MRPDESRMGNDLLQVFVGLKVNEKHGDIREVFVCALEL